MAQSAGNSATTYIASIKKFEENENLDDIVKINNYILKSCEEFVAGENVSGLTKILNEVPLVPFPTFYLGPLTAKLQLHQKINNDDFHSIILKVIQIPVELADYPRDANLAAFYFPLMKALGEAAIHKKCPLLVIKPLADGIRWWTEGNPRHLTPVHTSLLCCCLKARNFRFCMEFLEVDALSLVREGLLPRKVIPPLINCTTEPVLLYFYYGSLIHALHENFREALSFLEYLVSMRGMSQSAIVLEGFKKAILFALILGEKKLTFPGSKVVKYLINHIQSRPYLELAWIVTSAPKHIDVAALVVEHLERQKNKGNLNTFQRDQNMGLIEILMEKLKEKKIIDLPKTFTAVTRKQAMERTFIQETHQFDSLVRKLVAQGKLKCTIDQDNGILTFPQDDEASEGDQKELDSALLAVSKLTTVVRDATNLLKVAEAGNGMNKKNVENPEVIEFTEKIGKLKIDDLQTFFDEFNKIYNEFMERKQLLEEEVLLEEEKIPVLKKQVKKAIEDISVLKQELISAGDKTRKLISEQKKRFEKECPEEALAVEKILTLQKELDVLLFSKEFKKLVEQANLMVDSRSFKKFRESFDHLVKLPETSENYLPSLEASYQHEFEENRKIFRVNLKNMLYEKFSNLKFPFEQAVDLDAVKGELDVVTEILHSLHVVFKKGENEMSILQLVFDEFTKRFNFHFYGEKPTNSDAKPEWFFAEISAWISANLPFIVGSLQSLFIQLGEEEILVAEEFIESLVMLASEKVRSLIAKEPFLEDDKLLSHLIDETVLFEKELSEVYFYPESSPHVISELCRPDILERWIRMEQTTISAGIDSILSDTNAYESRFKDASDVDEHLVPNFADAFVLLMHAMVERYRAIPDDRIQCRFLKLELIIVDEFRSRMVQISKVMDNPLSHPNPQLLNAFWYMSQVLDEWSVYPEFIKLQNFMESRTVTVRGTFDDQSELYKHVWRQKAKALTQYFADLISFKLKPYSTIKWFQMENPKPTEVTPQFLPFLTEIQRLIEWINEEISPVSVMTFYHLTNHEVWNALDEIVVSQTNFHYRGAAQMLFDVTNGLIPLLESLYKWPKVTVTDGILNKKCVELLNTLKILSLPSPTAILLREEVEKNPEQMLEEKLQPFDVSGLSKQRMGLLVAEDESMKITQLRGMDQDGVTVRSTVTLVQCNKENGERMSILVDCGSPYEGKELVEELKMTENRSSGDISIDKVILTHSHIDHCGSLWAIKPKEIITAETMGDMIIKSDIFEEKIKVIKTPGHSNHDISVVCELGNQIVVIAGDIFEDGNDEETGSWKQQSQNEKIQEVSREFLKRIADIIVPGHGRFFQVKETAEEKKNGYVSPRNIRSEYFKDDLDYEKSYFFGNHRLDFPTGSVVVGGGPGGIDWKRCLNQKEQKLIYVHIGTEPFRIPFDAGHLPDKVYMESDIYTRKTSGEEEYASVGGAKTVKVELDEIEDTVIWRIPGPGGLIYPVFHYLQEGEAKLVLGSCMGVADSHEARNMSSDGPSHKAQRKGMAFLLQQMKSTENTVTEEEKRDECNDETRKRPVEDSGEENVESKVQKINPWIVIDEQKKNSSKVVEWNVDHLPTNPSQWITKSFLSQKKTLFNMNNNYVRSCKWSPSGKFLLTDSADHRTRMFEFDGEEIEESKLKTICQGGLIYDQKWHPSLDVFATTSNGHPVRIFDAQCNNMGTATCLNDYEEMDSAYSLAFSTDGQKLYAGFRNSIYLFDLEKNFQQESRIKTFEKNGPGQKSMISCIDMNPVFRGNYAAGCYNSSIGFYSDQSGKIEMVFETIAKNVTFLKFTPDGNKLLYGCAKSDAIQNLDVRFACKPLETFERKVDTNQRIYFDIDPSGDLLFSGSTEGKMLIFDLKKGESKEVRTGSRVTSGLSLHPEKSIVATSHGERVFPFPRIGTMENEDPESEEEDIMAQHKLSEKKSKAKLPANIQKKNKNKAKKPSGPKKGTQMTIAPKKKEAVDQAKRNAEISRVINERNEEMIRERLAQNTGRIEKK